jgi:hypothetical protein
MAHDLILHGGRLVDGSRREPVSGGLTINGEHTGEVRRQRR